MPAPVFAREADKRGLRLTSAVLEDLHRRSLLLPMFRTHRRRIAPPIPIDEERHIITPAWPVFLAAAQGRLIDPAQHRFTPWPKRGEYEIFYSPYQLLDLDSIKRVLQRIAMDETRGGRTKWHAIERRILRDQRDFSIVLEALATRYRPRVLHSIQSPRNQIESYIDAADSLAEAEFVQPVKETLRGRAENFLARAHANDPLGSWARVVRISNPRRWTELRGEALIAHEQRVAAEIVLQFLESEAAQGRADPIAPVSEQWWEPRHERLTVSERERAETVMDFRLSDRPGVYLALEGQTEVTLASKILGFAGLQDSAVISLVDLEGVDGDVYLLTRAVAVPRLDPDGHRGARIVSPLTALVVVVDPERRFATSTSRDQIHSRMIDEAVKSLPKGLRTPAMRRDLGLLIHLRSWEEEFEYAHFSPTELARALRRVAGRACPKSETDLRREIQHRRAAGMSFKGLWKSWRPKPSKVALAEELWPSLERRLANPRTRRGIPLVDVIEDSLQVSNEARVAREIAVEGP